MCHSLLPPAEAGDYTLTVAAETGEGAFLTHSVVLAFG